MSLNLTWGLLVIGLVISAVLYGISCAQTFFYFQFYPKDPLYPRALAIALSVLNTAHLGLAIHIIWFYLIDGEGSANDAILVWSWPTSIIVTIFISLAVYAFYIRRIRILGGAIWLCVAVGALGSTHFALAMKFSIALLIDNRMEDAVRVQKYVYSAIVAASMADLSIASIMSWRLWQSRTGHKHTDSMIARLIGYSVNTGLLTALCIVASLISGLMAQKTEFELFFFFIIPELRVNSYLGSLNNREVMRSKRNRSGLSSSSGAAHELSLRGNNTNTLVHVERTTINDTVHDTTLHKDGGLGNDLHIDLTPGIDAKAQNEFVV